MNVTGLLVGAGWANMYGGHLAVHQSLAPTTLTQLRSLLLLWNVCVLEGLSIKRLNSTLALFFFSPRRLNTLNKCALMEVEINHQRKQVCL